MQHSLKQTLARIFRLNPKTPTLYVHAGAGKTGTSGIQRFLGINRDKLRESGVEYPIFDTQVPITKFPWAGNIAFYGRDLNLGKVTQEDLNKTAGIILDSIKPGNTKVIVSGESLANTTPANIERFYAAFRPHFDIEFIFFLRDPLPWAYSAWKQVVRTVREPKTFIQFLEKVKIQPILFPEAWFSQAKKVHLLSYDEHKNNLTAAFFSCIGIDITSHFPEVSKVKANLSLTQSEVEMLRVLHTVPELSKDISVCHRLAEALLNKPERKPDTRPDPALAAMAIENLSAMFSVTDKYLHRSKIIRTIPDGAATSNTIIQPSLNPDDVRIALAVVADYLSIQKPSL